MLTKAINKSPVKVIFVNRTLCLGLQFIAQALAVIWLVAFSPLNILRVVRSTVN